MRKIGTFAACAAVLLLGCPGVADAAVVWQAGDLTTYTQVLWPTDSTAPSIFINNFNSVYGSNFGVLEVGIPGAAGYSIRLDSGAATLLFLPANGTIGPLISDLFDPSFGSPGAFGGDVVALELNVDYNDAGLLPSSGFVFGDLVVSGTGNAAFDGQTVRQLLASLNTALGGGPAIDSYANLDALAQNLNAAFAAGTPSAFAQAHLSASAIPAEVPEPSTWAMMLTGFAALGLATRRKRRRNFAVD
ncbi:MAG: PEPxxWA-CTERM sorting domain-containing protein [Sphingomicrobium sp.]